MPKGTNQKFKLYRLAQVMLKETDEDHFITLPEIQKALGAYEITADRKTLYADLKDLEIFGIVVEGEPVGKGYHYHVVERPFQLAELKLLVDAIQSSKFITVKKTRELIGKLEKMVSRYEASELQRQVFVAKRIKTMNESVYYTVDVIHRAIAENRKIEFQYFQWNVKKEMVLRHGGAWYNVSPWALVWDNENYYLIGYDSASGQIRHYRVDKMLKISATDKKREGEDAFSRIDIPGYSRQLFGMYGGEETRVSLEASDHMAGILIDRFGQDIRIIPGKSGTFTAYVSVSVSPQFLGWVFSLGRDVRITGPEKVMQMMREEGIRLIEQY